MKPTTALSLVLSASLAVAGTLPAQGTIPDPPSPPMAPQAVVAQSVLASVAKGMPRGKQAPAVRKARMLQAVQLMTQARETPAGKREEKE